MPLVSRVSRQGQKLCNKLQVHFNIINNIYEGFRESTVPKPIKKGDLNTSLLLHKSYSRLEDLVCKNQASNKSKIKTLAHENS